MNLNRMILILIAGAAVALTTVHAADIGAPLAPRDQPNKSHWELIYDDFSRELDTAGRADTWEGNALFVRFHTEVGATSALDFDAGLLDADGADGAFYGGLGLRLLVHDSEAWRIGAHVQVHYAPGVEAEETVGGEKFQRDLDVLEVDASLTAAAKIRLADGLLLLPYAGPAFSSLDLEGDLKGPGLSESIDAGEENSVGAVAGLALVMADGNTLRAEARVFDEVSFSIAAGIAF